MGRIAFALGIAGVSGATALARECNPVDIAQREIAAVPVGLSGALLQHSGTLLMVLLPALVAGAVFLFDAPRRRQLAALACAPIAFAAALALDDHRFEWVDVGLHPHHHMPSPWSLGLEINLLTEPALFLAALSVLPLAPILWFARGGESDDHDARARMRIGASLVFAAIVQLVVMVIAPTVWSQVGLSCALPPLAVLLFGLFEIRKNQQVLASLQKWLVRVRAGEVHGVRVREAEPADAAFYVPDLVTPEPLEDLDVLEAYADGADPDPYRTRRATVPLRRLPRA